jgi:hypothetical protein
MDRQQIGLKLTLDALGLPICLDTFSDRLVLQKGVYLAQASGVQLGYQYNWYLRGPYSPSLTRDAFAVAAELSQGLDAPQGWRLDETSQQRLQHLKLLFAPGDPKQHALHLELLASVHFLLQGGRGQGKSPAELSAILQRFGKNFTEKQIEDAIKELTEHALVPGHSSSR